LRGRRKDLDDFPHYTIGRNHTHVAPQVIAFAAIDEECVRRRIGAGANYLRGEHRCFGMRFVKIQQRFQALSFGGATFQLGVPEAEFVHFAAQMLILRAAIAQANVAAPKTADVGKGPGSGALKRSHQLHGPIADQPHIVFPFDLKREQKHLRKNDSCEQSQRAMA